MRQVCIICKKEGNLVKVERLPLDGLIMESIHDDGEKHRWTEYNSIFDLGNQRGHSQGSKRMVCPRCGKMGKIRGIRDRHIPKIRYRIYHGIENGKEVYCHIIEKEHRDIVLKKLGRYIDLDSQLKKRESKQIVCPRCNLVGNTKEDHIRSRYFVEHPSINLGGTWGKDQQPRYKQCCMRKGTEVELFKSRIA